MIVRAALAILLVASGCDALFGLRAVPADPDAPHGDGKVDASDAKGASDAMIDAFKSPTCTFAGLTCSNLLTVSTWYGCYAFCKDQVNYATAQTRCEVWGGALMILKSTQEDAALVQSLSDTTTFWMGMQQVDSTNPATGWYWNDATAVTNPRWYTDGIYNQLDDGADKLENGEEQCGWYSTLGWGDGVCDNLFQFACKK